MSTKPQRSRVSSRSEESLGDGEAGPEGGGELSRDEIFHILSNDRRRYLLHCVMQAEDNRVSLREVSRQVAAWENSVTAEEVEPSMRRRVYVALQQTHLPTLTDAGVVDYSEAESEVRITERFNDLRVYLESTEDIPWGEFYLGLGALVSALTALFWIDLPLFALVPDILWAAIVSAAFTVTAVIHVYADERTRLGGEGPPPSIVDE